MAASAKGAEALTSRWKCSRCARVKLHFLEEPVVLSDSPLDANAAPTRVVTTCVDCVRRRYLRQRFCELCGGLPHRVIDGTCRVCGLRHKDEPPAEPSGLNSSPIAAFFDW